MAVPEGVPANILKLLIDEERAKTAALPQDTRDKGVLRIPDAMLSAPMLEGDAQRNVPGILAMIQQEAEMREAMSSKAKARMGEGLSLPLSRGMMTFPADKIMSFMAVFED